MGQHKDFNSAFKSMYRKMASVQKSLPTILANEGTKFFVSNFDLSGFTDVGFQPWKPRKDKSKKVSKKKILVKTGRLRRAVNNSVREKSYRKIVWRVDPGEVPYAHVHNNGDVVYKKAHKRKISTGSKKVGERAFKMHNVSGTSFKMPRRHFMGKSEFLSKRFRLRIKQVYVKAFGK